MSQKDLFIAEIIGVQENRNENFLFDNYLKFQCPHVLFEKGCRLCRTAKDFTRAQTMMRREKMIKMHQQLRLGHFELATRNQNTIPSWTEMTETDYWSLLENLEQAIT